MDKQKNRIGLSGNKLKVIAMATMFLDRVGAVGRIAFPIYCFLLVQGFLHTRNAKKYLFLSGEYFSSVPKWRCRPECKEWKGIQRRSAQDAEAIKEYPLRRKDYVPSGEKLMEMRAAFGETVVVDAITGKKIKL